MMARITFDYRDDVGPNDDDHLKCHSCGYVAEYHPEIPYSEQSRCATFGCTGQMMGWDWGGWKANEARDMRRKLSEAAQEARGSEPVSQDSDDWSTFTEAERRIGKGLTVVGPGGEAPWLGAFGACMVRVYGIRRNNGVVEFGVGNELPPILDWVKADDFYHEWPQ